MKIALVDDHAIIRSLIGKYIETELKANVTGFETSQTLINRLKDKAEFDLHIVDLSLEDGVGFDVLDFLEKRDEKLPVIVYTSNTQLGVVKHCLNFKVVKGFVSKASPETELVNAIKMVSIGKQYFCLKTNQILNSKVKTIWDLNDIKEDLSRRERQVMNLIWKNFDSEQISKELNISKLTVETHRRNIKKKLGSESMIETIRKALDRGYINTLIPYE